MLLSALMKLASTSAAILYNSIGGIHTWQTHTKVKGSDKRQFILISDSILVYNFNHVNEFVPISKLMQSRNDKINSKNITETFLFSLFDSSIMSQILESVSTVKSLYFK